MYKEQNFRLFYKKLKIKLKKLNLLDLLPSYKEELKLIPKSSLYKTKLCQTFKNDICPFGVKCLYIHFQKNEYELF